MGWGLKEGALRGLKALLRQAAVCSFCSVRSLEVLKPHLAW